MKKPYLSLLSFFLLFLPVLASAQGDPCQKWSFEVCELPQTQPSGIDNGPSCPDNCFRVYYRVYLVNNGNLIGGIDEAFSFTNFFINGQLNTSSSDLSTVGKRLSKINISESIKCSPSDPGLNTPGNPAVPIIDYDQNANSFSYQVSSANYNLPVLNWLITGRKLLFTLAVDVFPGESVSLSIFYNNVVFYPTNGSGCTLTVLEGCGNPPNLVKSIPQPIILCTNAQYGTPFFRIGAAIDAPTQAHPRRKKVPVWVDAASPNSQFQFDEVDFLMGLAPNVGMLSPSIESGLIAESSVLPYPMPSNSAFRLYTHAYGVNVSSAGGSPNAGNILFYIILDGPQLESQCLEVSVNFPGLNNYGRITGPLFSCCKPRFGNSNIISWSLINGNPCIPTECKEVSLIAAHANTGGSVFCDNIISFNLNVSATSNTTINDLHCVLEIKKTGAYSLNSANSSSPACIPFTCATVTEISPTLLRVKIDLVGINLLAGPTINGGVPVKAATIAFTTSENSCIEGITFLDSYIWKAGATENCLTAWQSEFKQSNPGDDICNGGNLTISAETEDNKAIETWLYYINRYTVNNSTFPSTCYQAGLTGGATASACPCELNNVQQNVTIRKVDNPLNGVSTYDLVLISKHILGIEALTGLKILAGDANNSGSLTTFDIVELRKLILGIYDTLPANRSWRFFDKDFVPVLKYSTDPFMLLSGSSHYYFGPLNPDNNAPTGDEYTHSIPRQDGEAWYYDEEFDEFAYPAAFGLDKKAEFVGFKVGDTNGTALPNGNYSANEYRYETLSSLGITPIKGKSGVIVDIPVFTLEAQDWAGWQFGLGFNPEDLEILDIRWAGANGSTEDRGWHIVQPGALRLLWFDGAKAHHFTAGAPLFYIHARLLRDQTKPAQLIDIQTNSIQSVAYSYQGRAFGLNLQPSSRELSSIISQPDQIPAPVYNLMVYPNPAGINFRINIEASASAQARLVIRDLLGHNLDEKALELVSGLNVLRSTELTQLPAGQYQIILYTPSGTQNAILVKQ